MKGDSDKGNQSLGQPKGSPGITNGANLKSGLSSHRQIRQTTAGIGQKHGEGQRPTGSVSGSATHHGKTFRFR